MNTERPFTKAEIEYLGIPEIGELKNKLYESIVKARALQKRIDELEGAIAAHNKECDFLCVNDKHCDHRPRQCASCPKDWKVNI
jgi:hypothetical protein